MPKEPQAENPSPQETDLDPDFEAALAAALSLDPSERIDRYSQLTDTIKEQLA